MSETTTDYRRLSLTMLLRAGAANTDELVTAERAISCGSPIADHRTRRALCNALSVANGGRTLPLSAEQRSVIMQTIEETGPK